MSRDRIATEDSTTAATNGAHGIITPVVIACVLAWLGFLVTLPARPSAWLVTASGLPLLALVSWRAARRAPQPWGAFVRETADLHALGGVLLYAVGVQLADSHGISTDGVTYFTQLRSLVFDRDLDVTREFAVLEQGPRPNHVVPIGPTLVWTPLYLAVAALDALGRAAGLWAAPSDPTTLGLGLPYIRAAGLSSFAIGAAGVWALHDELRRRFARGIAFTTSALVVGATPLFWYLVYEPSMTHAASFGFSALFAVASVRWVPEGVTRQRALALGGLVGLAFCARPQDAVFALLPGVLMLSTADAWPVRIRRASWLAGWALAGAAPWLVMQAVHTTIVLSRYSYAAVGEGAYLNPWQSRWLDTLFSSWHGFFSWTPVVYLAALGTVAYLRRDWRWAAPALAVLFVTAWVNGATQDWAGGWSFGGRRFTSVVVLLAPGLALLLEALVTRPLLALAPVVAGALWWNHLLMVQYTAGMLPKDEPVSFARMVRQQGDVAASAPFVYPFAFPANAWFAWRTGLPVAKYDVLGPERPRPSFTTTFDRTVEKFLLERWEAPAGDDWGSAWWLGGTPATMTVPLALPPGRAQVTIRSRTRLEEPVVQAALALDINGVQVGQFVAGVPEPSTAIIVIPAEMAARVLRPGFNTVAFRSLGVSRVDPNDPRPAGPLARRRDAAWPVAFYELRIEPLP